MIQALFKYLSKVGLDFNIDHGLFVGWVVHPDIFCWVSFLNPTYVPAIFLLSAKPNKMAEDRTVPKNVKTLHNIFSVILQLSISVIRSSKGFRYIDNVPQQHYSSTVFSEATLHGQFPERIDHSCG